MFESPIDALYDFFSKKDYRGMASCYHDQAVFSDPVFPELKGQEIAAMWHMLCENSRGLKINHHKPCLTQDTGQVIWEAHYLFGASKREVHNIIHATFTFRDGLIYRHTDEFDFWRWSRMALGLPGTVLGWSPYFRSRVQQQASGRLRAFISAHAQYSGADQ